MLLITNGQSNTVSVIDLRTFLPISTVRVGQDPTGVAANNYGYDFLPKITGDHSHMPMFIEMMKGTIKGFFAMGQNPAVGGQNASYQRQALAKLDWLVVRDLYETETASFWKDSPEVKAGTLKTADIQTEVFFLPAAAVAEMDGSFTNTQRLLQWHHKAVEPPGECRSELDFIARKVRAASIAAPRLRPLSLACLISMTVSSASMS